MKTCNIQIRDPFVFVEDGKYYLFGSTDKNIWQDAKAIGFDFYVSAGRLDEFDGPYPAFRPPAGFWSENNFWAAEVHSYKGGYYLFATFLPKPFAAGMKTRGSAILKSTGGITGPYIPHSKGTVTPRDWECLDGTLFIENGAPFMVFCHAWMQVGDGEICAIPLSPELDAAAGEPALLFRASEAPWAFPLKEQPIRSYVTDSPFMHRASDGSLFLLWSSFAEDGQRCIGAARSESGALRGPWIQSKTPLYGGDAGHGMIFRLLDGRLALAVHIPNQTPKERPVFIELIEKNGELSAGRVL